MLKNKNLFSTLPLGRAGLPRADVLRKVWHLAVFSKKRNLNARKVKKYSKTGRLQVYADRSPIFGGGVPTGHVISPNGDDDVFQWPALCAISGFLDGAN